MINLGIDLGEVLKKDAPPLKEFLRNSGAQVKVDVKLWDGFHVLICDAIEKVFNKI